VARSADVPQLADAIYTVTAAGDTASELFARAQAAIDAAHAEGSPSTAIFSPTTSDSDSLRHAHRSGSQASLDKTNELRARHARVVTFFTFS